MKVIGYINPVMKQHRPKLMLMAEGMLRHGLRLELRDYRDYVSSDLAVMWGHRFMNVINAQRSISADYLVMERGFLGDRHKWNAVGFNGLNGRGIYQVKNVDNSRLKKYFNDVLKRPADNPNGYVLIMGQCPGDASLRGKDIVRWAKTVADEVSKKYPERVVFYRPHPVKPVKPRNLKILDGDLQAALDGAWCVITYNSNSGVDAAANGNRVVAFDEGSMSWTVSTHNISEPPRHFPRRRWAERLAWCQWTDEEIRRGDAWDHLKVRYE